jgi:hypothetical protein
VAGLPELPFASKREGNNSKTFSKTFALDQVPYSEGDCVICAILARNHAAKGSVFVNLRNVGNCKKMANLLPCSAVVL